MLIADLGIQFQPSDRHSRTDIIQVPVNSVLLHFYSDIRSCSSPKNVRLDSLRTIYIHRIHKKYNDRKILKYTV